MLQDFIKYREFSQQYLHITELFQETTKNVAESGVITLLQFMFAWLYTESRWYTYSNGAVACYLTVKITSAELLCILCSQSISMIESNLLPSKNACLECK
jgi:hypothetical protein